MTLLPLPKAHPNLSGKYSPVDASHQHSIYSDCHHLQERLSLHPPQTTIIRALVLQQFFMRACLNNNRVVHVPIGSSSDRSRERAETHKMRSACLVRFPKRCVENIIVLFPRNFRSREKRSRKKTSSQDQTKTQTSRPYHVRQRDRVMRLVRRTGVIPPLVPLLKTA